MDYIFSSSVLNTSIRYLTISYNVGCQWFTKFWKYLMYLLITTAFSMPMLAVHALVPNFYLQSHEEKCQVPFSYNYQKGTGRTEGKGVEQNWDWRNPQEASTSEMTPGNWWDTLNDCFGWLNFWKSMGLGEFPQLTIYAELIIFLQATSCLSSCYILYLRWKKLVVTTPYLTLGCAWIYQTKWLPWRWKFRHGSRIRHTLTCIVCQSQVSSISCKGIQHQLINTSVRYNFVKTVIVDCQRGEDKGRRRTSTHTWSKWEFIPAAGDYCWEHCARGSSLDLDSAGSDVASGKTQSVAMLSTTNGWMQSLSCC